MDNIQNINTNLFNKDCFIAYFDILGYENKISNSDSREYLEYYRKIKGIVDDTKELVSSHNSQNDEIRMKVFSDNFIFFVEKDYFALVCFIACLQSALVTIDVFIRGSISYGNIIFNEDLIYGSGLIEAYKLENNIAFFPRIIVDSSYFIAVKKIESEKYINIETFLKPRFLIDTDLLYYLDYLYAIKDYIIKGEKDIVLKKFKEILFNHAKNIKKNLSTNRIEIKQKYNWCKKYHNTYCDEHGFKDYIILD